MQMKFGFLAEKRWTTPVRCQAWGGVARPALPTELPAMTERS